MRKTIVLLLLAYLFVPLAYGASWKDKSGIAEVTSPAGTEFIPVQITTGGVTTDHWIALDTIKTWAFANVSEIAGVSSTEVGYLDGVTSPIQEQINAIVAGNFAFDTYPTYEDSPHTGSGIAVNGTTLAVYSSTAGKWLTVGLTDSLNPTPVPPTIGTWAIDTDGVTVTATLSESCVEGASFASGVWTMDCTVTGPLDMGDPSGLPGTALTWTMTGGPVLSTATDTECLVYHTNAANIIEDATGDDLVGWATGVAVTNGSTVSGETLVASQTTQNASRGGAAYTVGQQFVVPATAPLAKVRVYMTSVSGDVTCRVGASADLGTTYLEQIVVTPAGVGWLDIPSATNPSLVTGSSKWLMCASGGEFAVWDGSSVYTDGTYYYADGSPNWYMVSGSISNRDLTFEVYTQ